MGRLSKLSTSLAMSSIMLPSSPIADSHPPASPAKGLSRTGRIFLKNTDNRGQSLGRQLIMIQTAWGCWHAKSNAPFAGNAGSTDNARFCFSSAIFAAIMNASRRSSTASKGPFQVPCPHSQHGCSSTRIHVLLLQHHGSNQLHAHLLRNWTLPSWKLPSSKQRSNGSVRACQCKGSSPGWVACRGVAVFIILFGNGTRRKDWILAPPLTDLLNAFFVHASIPCSASSGLVTPTHKKGCANDPVKDWPIPVEEPLYRWSTTILNDRLPKWIKANGLLQPCTGWSQAWKVYHPPLLYPAAFH